MLNGAHKCFYLPLCMDFVGNLGEWTRMKKTIATILIAIIAASALSLAASASAMPFMNWKSFSNMPGNSHRMATQQSFARLDGMITKYGSTNDTCTLQAQSRTVVSNTTNIRQGSSATAIWTTNQSRPISALRAKENYTYTFYSANLVNASVSSLNMTGYSFSWTAHGTCFK